MHADEQSFEGAWYQFPVIKNAGTAALITAAAWGLAVMGTPLRLTTLGYLLAILVGARFWAREGWEAFMEEREVGIDALMAAAALGAILLGQWLEGALLVVIYAAAEALEEFTYARTRHAIRALLDLAPPTARRLREGAEEEVPAASLSVGEVIVIRPGERVPSDAVVVQGRSSLEEASVTGESIPVEKGPGEPLFAGTVNTTGALTARVTARFEENTLSRMIRLVEEAQEVKSRAQRWIERFGRRYSPAVLVTSILLLLVPPLFGAPFATWAYRAVVLLVAAAPCALVMSTPVATAAAISRAGGRGVLIKGGIHLEELNRVRVVAFDKTGTLTRGRPQVTDLVPVEGVSEAELLSLAAAVERWSEHPLARAVVERAEAEGISIPDVEGFEALPGAGARARLGAETVQMGSATLLQSAGLDATAQLMARVQGLQAEGKTVVLAALGSEVVGAIAFRDEPRPEAFAAVDRLRAMGLRLVMLTGDHQATAHALGEDLGLDEVRAGLRPEEKVAAIRELEARYGPVAMAGDGINDAPALAAATVGIAMGLAGSDAAVEAADVALMGDDPCGVVTALKVARGAQRIARQNIVFSILLLIILVPSAILGFLGVAATVLLHEMSELLAVANGLRAARV